MHCEKQFAVDVRMGTEIRLQLSSVGTLFAMHMWTKGIPLLHTRV